MSKNSEKLESKALIEEMKSFFNLSSVEDLAVKLGYERSTATTWRSKGISSPAIERYKNLVLQSKNLTNINNEDGYTSIKLYPNIKASCANGSVCVVEDYETKEIKFPTSYLLNSLGIKCARNVHAIVADGNSMEPLIKDGDILFVTPFDIIRDGNVYIVNVNGEIYCKKVFKNPITKGITLRGENESAPKYEIPESDLETVKFMGEVFVAMNINVLRRLR